MDLPRHPLLFALFLAVSPAPVPAQEEWVSLFDGKTLAGWKAAEHPDSFSVVDGLIQGRGPRAHLFYQGADGKAEFENFELELEAKPMPGCNSGVYFHATWQDANWPRKSGFEVQINNTQPAFDRTNYTENKKTGSLYGVRNLYKAMVKDGEWFTMNILVRKPRVEVRLNGKLMMEYIEPANQPVLNPGTTMNFLTKGAFALQCHDEKSQVYFRNIRVRRLPPGEDAGVVKPVLNAQDLQRAELAKDNFPLVNLVRVKSPMGLSLGRLQELRNRTGIFPGIIANFTPEDPVGGDDMARKTMAGMKDVPAFAGLVLFGLTKRTPLESLAQYDFIMVNLEKVFTGVRAPEQEPAAMDSWVDSIVRTIETMPIDVYANVMMLPGNFQSSADVLWTEQCMQRVCAAAAKYGVALEINSHLRTPSEQFIKLAKAAGVRFTVGSDGTTVEDYADWSYILEMQRKLGLTWRNMWVPGHEPTRAQRELAKQ